MRQADEDDVEEEESRRTSILLNDFPPVVFAPYGISAFAIIIVSQSGLKRSLVRDPGLDGKALTLHRALIAATASTLVVSTPAR